MVLKDLFSRFLWWIQIGLCLLTLSCSSLEKWERINSDKRTFQVRKLWVRDTLETLNEKHRKINRMTPLIAGNLIVQGNGMDGLVAYDRQHGAEMWRVNITNGVEAGAVAINDRLFFGGSDGNFYGVSLRDGKILWTYPTKAENLSAPILDSETGTVYFLSGNNVVYALDGESGKQIWTYSRQDTNNFSIRGGTKPALKNGLLYVGFSEGSLIAFNARSGSPVWEAQLNKNKKFKDIDSTPVLDGNYLYVAGYDDRLYCLDANKGDIIWKIEGGSYSGITMDADRIYYPTSQGEVWALQKNNGAKIWTYKLREGLATGVRIYKGLAVFGESQGSLVFLDLRTGKKIGEFEPGRGILSAPLGDDKSNRVYFVSGEANLYALEAGWFYPSWFSHLR